MSIQNHLRSSSARKVSLAGAVGARKVMEQMEGRVLLSTTWYVDDVATNGDGSLNNPWNDVSNAIAQVTTKGDTIHLKAGSYTETAQMNLAEGVNLEGEGRDTTILTANVAGGIGLRLYTSSGSVTSSQRLSNFRIKSTGMTTNTGIQAQHRNNVVLDNLYVEGFKNQGAQIFFTGTSTDPGIANYLTGIEVKNCYFKDNSSAGASSYSGALEIGGLKGALIHDNVIEGLRADHGYGIKFCNEGWIADSEIYNNTVNLTTTTVTGGWGAPFSIELFNAHSDTEIYNNTVNGTISLVKDSGYAGTQLRVHDNRLIFPGTNDREGIEGNAPREVIYNNYFENVSTRNAIRVDWGADDFEIHHNVFRNLINCAAIEINPRGTSGQGANCNNINIYQNTIDNAAVGVQLTNDTNKGLGTISNVTIKNNIIMNSAKGVSVAVPTANLTTSNVQIDYNNSYNNTVDNFTASGAVALPWGANNIDVAPNLKLTGAFAYPYYEHTSGTGNMVNAGNATGLSYVYSGFVGTPDIGANEFGLAGRSRVTIAATDAAASEAGPDTGTFTITRTATQGTLTVNYTVSGSARAADYTGTFPGSVSFADGQATQTIAVTPVNDSWVDGGRDVKITLTPNSAYDITAQTESAVVTIADNDALATDIGFETAEGYATGALNGQKGWVAGTAFTVASNPKGAGQVMKIDQLVRFMTGTYTPSSTELGGTLNTAADTVSFLFKVYAAGAWGYNVNRATLGTSGNLIDFDFRGNTYYNGATTYPIESAPGIAPAYSGDWVTFGGVIDYATKKYSLYVDGAQQYGGTTDGWLNIRNAAASAANLFPKFEAYADNISAAAYYDNVAFHIQDTSAPVNQAPVLAGIETTTLAYTENAAATSITGAVTLTDADSANMTSATVRISTNYQNGQDVLSFTNTGTITGSWNASTGILTLSGSDTKANYQAALRAVKYQNTSENPNTAVRTISLAASDGTSSSNTVTRNLSVTAVNDNPTFTSTAVTSATVGTAYSYSITTSDAEGQTRTITAPTKPAWLTLVDNGNGTATLSGTPTAAANDSVVLRVTDASSGFTQQSFTINVGATSGTADITFDGYTTGALVGQDGWTGSAGQWTVAANPSGSGKVMQGPTGVRYMNATRTLSSTEVGGTFNAASSKIDYSFKWFGNTTIWGFNIEYFGVGATNTSAIWLRNARSTTANNVGYYDGTTAYNVKNGSGIDLNMNSGAWHMFSGTLDYATKKYTLYVNGVQQLGGTTNGWIGFNNPTDTANFAPAFNGYVDNATAPFYYDDLNMQLQATSLVTFDNYSNGEVIGQDSWTGDTAGWTVAANPSGSGKVLQGLTGIRYKTATRAFSSTELGGTFNVALSKVAYSFDLFGNTSLWGYTTQYTYAGGSAAAWFRNARSTTQNNYAYYDGATMYNFKNASGVDLNMNTGAWYTVSGTLDYAAKKYTLFVNGVQQMGGTTDGWLGFNAPADTVNQSAKVSVYVDNTTTAVYYDNISMILA